MFFLKGNMKKYKIGLVLGGGGTRGFAHLGVIKALQERGIVPDVISGVSAGAIAGSLMSDGKTPEEALKIMKGKSFFDYTRIQLPRQGFFSLKGLRKELEKFFSVKRIEDLKTDFFVAVTNFNKGKVEYHNSGKLVDFVIASASIPVMFEPVKINEDLYVDGGLVDNLPAEPLKNICEKIIAVNLVPVLNTQNVGGLKNIISRTLDMAVNCKLPETEGVADIIISPPELSRHDFFSTKKADEIFGVGYNYVKNLDVIFD